MKKIILVVVSLMLVIVMFGCSKTQDANDKSVIDASLTNSSKASSVKSANSITSNKSNGSALGSNSANSIKNSINNSLNSVNSAKSNSANSANASSSTAGDNKVLNYSERMNVYLESNYIGDATFKNKISNIREYSSSESVVSNAIYASPNGNGSGTFNSPCSLDDGLSSVSAGQTLYLLEGTYNSKNSDGYYLETKGNANAYITIRPYPNAKVLISNSYVGSEVYAFQLGKGCCYTIIEGLEIGKMTSNNARGIVVWGDGQNHLIIRNNTFFELKTNSPNPETDWDSGANSILLMGEKTNAISNIFIYKNYCHSNVTGWAETISVAGNCEYVYVVENKVEQNTNIGIDFYGNAKYCSTASLDQPRFCIAAGNEVSESVCSYADCAGLYVDGARDILLAYNKVTKSQYGIEIGSEEKNDSYPVKNIIVKNNLVVNNNVAGIRIGGYETSSTGYVRNTKIYNNTIVNNDCGMSNQAEIVLAKVDGIDIRNNAVLKTNKIGVLVSSDFVKSYTLNLTFKNNYYYVKDCSANQAEFELYSTSQEGISAFNSAVSGADFYQAFSLSATFELENSSPLINSADNSVDVGLFDYLLKQRRNGTLDVGAIEKQ